MHRFLPVILVLVPILAEAQEFSAEITPYVGVRFGGTFENEERTARYEMEDSESFGLIVAFPYDVNAHWEIIYSYQDSEARYIGDPGPDPLVDTEIHVLQLGGTYRGSGEKAIPYLAATLGGTHIRTRSTDTRDDTFFSGSIGIGMMFLPTSRVGIRVEARAYGTFVSNSSELFCSTGPDANLCAIRIEGTLLSVCRNYLPLLSAFYSSPAPNR
jgi:hypothetical protein